MPADPLSKLVATLETSPAMYVADSGIWSYPGDEQLKRAIADVVEDQRNLAERGSAILAEREVTAPQAGYPLSFTAWHDLDLAFLLPRIIEGMRRQIDAIEGIIAMGSDDAAADGLSKDAMAATRRHIDILEQQASRLRAAPASA